MTRSNLVSIGLRAKTGRAIAVVLGGRPDAPVVTLKTEISLVDPKLPATQQPYHVVMELPWPQWQQAVTKTATAIEHIAAKALASLISELQARAYQPIGLAIVGAPDRDLVRIGNPHIRAHAAEGVLFRHVLELAAEANGVKYRTFSDRDFNKAVAAELNQNYSQIRKDLDNLRKSVSPPWRTDEKQAAMAAWMVLHG